MLAAMRWSIRLGRWFGTEVYLHLTFLLLLGFVGFSSWASSRDAGQALDSVLFYVALFACVLLHEFGHALAARRYGIRTRDITLLPIGGLARLDSTGETPWQELVIALGGPIVNVVIAAGLYAGMRLTGHLDVTVAEVTVRGSFPMQLLVANVVLFVFNLIPAFPMDGGRVLRALLSFRLDKVQATRIAAAVGKGAAFLFAFAGLFWLKNPLLMFIALFVWMGAGQEEMAVRTQSILARVPVRSAMLTDFHTVSPFDSLGDVSGRILAGSQKDFPVVHLGELEGVLVHAEFFPALRDRGPDTLVREVMRTGCLTARPSDELETVLRQLQEAGGTCTTIPVLTDGRLVGLVTAENVGEFVMIRTALAARDRTA